MSSLTYYTAVAAILACGMWATLSVADRALHRQDVVMQEGF